MWKRKMGESAFRHIAKEVNPEVKGYVLGDQQIANILDRALECGFQAPERPPVVNERGTAVLWPDANKTTLTTRGLVDFYQREGHRYFLLRMEELIEGCGPMLLPRLQEVLAAYERECERRGYNALPVDNRVFVGATKDEPVVLPNAFPRRVSDHAEVR
jgi:hypothetical protein